MKRYFQISWLPVLLIFFLVVETYLFNRWLNIIPQLYFVRRTASAVGLGALLYGPALFIKKRGRRFLYLGFISTLVALVFLTQFIYYQYSGGFLEFSAIFYANQTTDLGATIKTLLGARLFLFVAPIVLVVVGFFCR